MQVVKDFNVAFVVDPSHGMQASRCLSHPLVDVEGVVEVVRFK